MHQRGIAHAIGPLKISDRDPIGQTEPVEGVARLHDIDYPIGRVSTWHRGLGWDRRNIDHNAGKQCFREQAVGLL